MSDTKPQRIQRKRTKGWKMPPNTKCVTRPGRYGNPYATAEEYRRRLIEEGAVLNGCYLITPEYIRRDLRGFNLACFCRPGDPCHADVLLELANAAVEGAAK